MSKRSALMYLAAALTATVMLFVGAHTSAQLGGSAAGSGDSLKGFLQTYLRDPTMGIDNTTKYAASSVDLRGDGVREAIVYVTGQNWCASGGCVTLVLAPDGATYRVVSRILITRPPIRVLTTKSHGWRDISVRVQGGGDVVGYEARLSFDGTSYPISPSNNRAEKLKTDVPGDVVIPPDVKVIPLY